jgi:23S rRNA pseudouridine1911/1915/1917 synthase
LQIPPGCSSAIRARTESTATRSLLDVLRDLVPGASNRTLRQVLEQGRVRVNGEVCKVAKRSVTPEDAVEIGDRTTPARVMPGLEIIFEDTDLLVVHKPAGLLTVATPHEKEHTAYLYLQLYLKQREPKKRLFIVHRLDKFVSGLLVFAKSEVIKSKLQELFQRHDIQRKYWAIVEGQVARDSGTIESRLAEDTTRRMHSTQDRTHGKQAITHYRVLRRFPRLTALEVTLETGRKNQIRVHLSESGHPIVGDRAYGSNIDPMGRMGLHAFCLGFIHPTKRTPLLFETDPPPEFRRYLLPH